MDSKTFTEAQEAIYLIRIKEIEDLPIETWCNITRKILGVCHINKYKKQFEESSFEAPIDFFIFHLTECGGVVCESEKYISQKECLRRSHIFKDEGLIEYFGEQVSEEDRQDISYEFESNKENCIIL